MDTLLEKPQAFGRRGLDSESLKKSFLEWLVYSVGKDPSTATDRDWFVSVALSLRDRIVDRWMDTTRGYYKQDVKRVYYLSLEFLIGRLLTDTMTNLGVTETVRHALGELNVDLDRVVAAEPDAALGNGGLGRLAACFMDSISTLGLPGYGYGIRYEHGLFEQEFHDGWQIEHPETWLQSGNPWEFARPEVRYQIQFYGRVEQSRSATGEWVYRWVDTADVVAMAYDTPVPGYGRQVVNTLRLWSAKAVHGFQLDRFNQGDYVQALEHKILAENLSRVLYPNDSTPEGRELRLKQEFFFASASIQDLIRRHLQHHDDVRSLPEKAAIQLNDTHPAIGVAELMRLLIDVHGLSFEEAWDITRRTFSYTNHTLLPEALEAWPVPLVERLLPRHMQIIYEINAVFLNDARDAGADGGEIARLSLIDEHGERRVRMGNLAFIGSHKVNGVSALHTDLMRATVFADLHKQFPDRIVNKTNGITPRRWLLEANPSLSQLISSRIGNGWICDLAELETLKGLLGDDSFRTQYAASKRINKELFADFVSDRMGLTIDPRSIFDAHIKRIHEYKRQLLNILQTVVLYNEIRDNPMRDRPPVTKIFAGKAAAGYWMAKLIIKLINDVARKVNEDPAVKDRLKVVYLPNYNVSVAQRIIPASDLSEQISTAGMEASGTGNMKLALNGAITIGTLDGANVEIREAAGPENVIIFGMTADEVAALKRDGYNPREVIERDPVLKRTLDMIAGGVFSPDDPGRFHPILQALTDHGDPFYVLADFAAYCTAQEQASDLYADHDRWLTKAIINTASMGWFSSDRTVSSYASEIWNIRPVSMV